MSTSGVSSILSSVNDAFDGKTTGIDVNATVTALMQVQRAPETLMQNQQSTINSEISALSGIASELTQLQTSVNNLKDVFGALSQKTVTSADSTIVTATAQYTAPTGSHSVVVQQLATISSSYSDPISDASGLSGTQISIAYGDSANPVKTDTIDSASDRHHPAAGGGRDQRLRSEHGRHRQRRRRRQRSTPGAGQQGLRQGRQPDCYRRHGLYPRGRRT